MNDTPATENNSENNGKAIILGLYAGLVLALIGQIVPVMTLQLGGALLLLVLLACAGHLRKKYPPGTNINTHAVYFIRTIWAWSFILMICLGLAGYYASTLYSYDEFLTIAQTLAAGDTSGDEVRKFGMLGLVATLPSLAYLAYRLGRGLYHALRGTNLPHPKTFF